MKFILDIGLMVQTPTINVLVAEWQTRGAQASMIYHMGSTPIKCTRGGLNTLQRMGSISIIPYLKEIALGTESSIRRGWFLI